QLGETADDQERNRRACEAAVVAECRGDTRFAVNNWPVSDRMYVFVDKSIAAQVWDAGIGSSSVNIREPEYPEDQVFRPLPAVDAWGADLGLAGPRGLAADPTGRLLLADTENNRILVLEAGEVVQTIAPEDDPFRQP